MANELTKDDDEPSIEDILSSIRDIISDEDDENEVTVLAEEGDVDPVTTEGAESENDDVLDLTDVADDTNQQNVPEEGDMASDEKLDTNDIDAMFDTPSDENDPLAGINLAHPSGDDLDVTDAPKAEENADKIDIDAMFDTPLDEPAVEDVAEETAEQEAEVIAPQESVEAKPTEDEKALLNEAASFATVSSMAKLAENIAISRTSAGTTLEDITRDLLRPMLKDWLDENLPTIIERLVAKELERLAEKAARK